MFIDHQTLLRLTKGYLSVIEARRLKESEAAVADAFRTSSGLSYDPSKFSVLGEHEGLTKALHDLMLLDVEYIIDGPYWNSSELASYEDKRQKAKSYYDIMMKFVGGDEVCGPIHQPILRKNK